MIILMKKAFKILIVFLLLDTFCLKSAGVTLYIKDQIEFNDISRSINMFAEKGECTIKVVIMPGIYEFSEQHIMLKDINAPKICLKIIAKDNVRIIPYGKTYKKGDSYVGSFNINNSWINETRDISIWGGAKNIDGLIEVLDEKNKKCRFKSKNSLLHYFDVSKIWVLIPQWFSSKTYKVEKIEDDYIYFTASDLKKSYNNGWSVNDDYNYANKELRYRLCNAENTDCGLEIINDVVLPPRDCSLIHEGKVQNFLTIDNCSFKTVEIHNMHFIGNGARNNTALLFFRNCNNKKIVVKGCEFVGMRSGTILVSSSSNCIIKDNYFRDCYYYGVMSNNTSSKTSIVNNQFYMMGKGVQNSFCISCSGEKFLIKNNILNDFGYGGIAIGVWYGSEQKNPCQGLVENNLLIYSTPYIEGIKDYGLMDGGAIYLYTKNDGSVIRHNYISEYSGAGGNRGVFCDDGAYGFEIYGNVITNIGNGDLCIASRRDSSVEIREQPSTGIERSNINILVRDNLLDGRILFEGNDDLDNGCIKGRNYVIKKDTSQIISNKITNIPIIQEDIYFVSNKYKNEKIIVSKQDYRTLRKSKEWSYLKHYVWTK